MSATTEDKQNGHGKRANAGAARGENAGAGAARDPKPDTGDAPIGRGHEQYPLKHYLVLMGAFTTLTTATVAALRAAGRPFPTRVPPSDVLLLGLATNRLSRLLTRDKVMRAVRAPFTEIEPGASPDEVKERPRPVGDSRQAIGELLTCPRCAAMWAAAALACGYMASPRATRFVAGALASAAVSDYVNTRFAAAQQAAHAAG